MPLNKKPKPDQFQASIGSLLDIIPALYTRCKVYTHTQIAKLAESRICQLHPLQRDKPTPPKKEKKKEEKKGGSWVF